ncbi:MAG TPA: glycerophosphodiester phosphodiesterase [Gemmatimonadaceae bacterium]|nr:glycerophosphodiester phosphodiesterase [Gemmatimonadaceae bacterium]
MIHPLLDPDRRPIVGHRGNAAHAPENTMESYRQALAAGAECVELDLRLSADGVPVVMHDPTVDRTTDSSGAVASLSVDQLRRADAGARFTRDGGRTFPYRDKGIRVPTLEDVLTELADVPLLVEIKTAQASSAVRRLIERHGAESRCVIESFDARALEPFRGSRLAIGASRADVARLLHRIVTRRPVRSLPYSIMCLPPRLRGVPMPIASLVRLTRPAGCLVHMWTINEPEEARRLWSVGVRGIVSDDPGLMRRTRDAA